MLKKIMSFIFINGFPFITALLGGLATVGLAFGGAAFPPLGLAILFGAGTVTTVILNYFFYRRDTGRIAQWLNPRSAIDFWDEKSRASSLPENIDSNSPSPTLRSRMAKKWRHFRHGFAGLLGWAELEKRLYLKKYQQRIVCGLEFFGSDSNAKDPFYQYKEQSARFKMSLTAQDIRDFFGIMSWEQFVDLSGDDYKSDTIKQEQDSFAFKVAFNLQEGELRVSNISEDLLQRLWYHQYYAGLISDRKQMEYREQHLNQMLKKKRNSDLQLVLPAHFGASLLVRRAATFVFLALAAAMSIGMSLVALNGIEGFLVTVGATAFASSPLGIGLMLTCVAIAGIAIFVQLYVTFNEFWADAYHPKGHLNWRLRLMQKCGYNVRKKQWNVKALLRSLVKGLLLAAVLVAAVLVTMGYFKSFMVGLEKLFAGPDPLLVRLSERAFNVLRIVLTVAMMSRLKMALILMTRGAVRLLNGFGFGLKMLWDTIKCPFSKAARNQWVELYNPERKPLYQALFWWVLIPINATMQIFWATSGQVPAPFNGVTLEKNVLAPVAFLQSFLLMYRTNMPRITGRYRQDMAAITGRIKNCLLSKDDNFNSDRAQASLKAFAAKWASSDGCESFGLHGARVNPLWGRGQKVSVIDLMMRALLLAHITWAGSDTKTLLDLGVDSIAQLQGLYNAFKEDNHVDLNDIREEEKLKWAEFIFCYMRAKHLQQRPWLPGTRRVLGRLWELGLVRWLTKAAGLGGAVWFMWPLAGFTYSVVTQGKSLSALLMPGATFAVPLTVLLVCLALVVVGTVLVQRQIKRRRLGLNPNKTPQKSDKANQLAPLEANNWVRFMLKVLGAAGTAWFVVGGIPLALGASAALVFPLSWVAVGVALLAASATEYCDKRNVQLPAFLRHVKGVWLDVMGAGAATWFLWSGIQMIAGAALSAAVLTTASYVVLGLVAVVTVVALWRYVRSGSQDSAGVLSRFDLFKKEGDVKLSSITADTIKSATPQDGETIVPTSGHCDFPGFFKSAVIAQNVVAVDLCLERINSAASQTFPV